MIVEPAETIHGACGTATRLEYALEAHDPPDARGTVTAWWLDCPGQSPFWHVYLLSVVHLRPLDGVRPAVIGVPGATHELVVVALDPREPTPLMTDPTTWKYLTPVNVAEQLELPDDDAARYAAYLAAWGVVEGVLPAEPPHTGQREPWRTSLVKTAAHLRGEVHAS